MEFKFTPQEERLFKTLKTAADSLGVPAYIVGGYVRDKILDRPTKDIDIVCVGSGIDLAHELAKRLNPKPHVSFFKNFGTAMLKHEGMEVEFVGARRESYQRDSRKPIVEDGTLEDDQNRRDFTINALAISLNDADYGQLVDPFGGVEDLGRGIIRTPLDPDVTFSDDPLRMMRAIRFASQLNFVIQADTLMSISRNAARIEIISAERIAVELEKILMSKKPSVGLKLLFDVGLLKLIFPELVALQGVQTGEGGYQHKDNFYHTLKVVDNIAEHTNNLWLRWAAVLHDIGKTATKRYDKVAGWTFHGHEVVGERMVPKIFQRMRLPLDGTMRYVQTLVRLHQRPVQLTKEEISDSAVRRLLFEAGECADDLMTLCHADITSRNQERVRKYRQNYEFLVERMKAVEEKDQLRNWQPPISGELIMATFGIEPSKEVGLIKTAIREAILDGLIENNYDAAFAKMLEEGEKLNLKVVSV